MSARLTRRRIAGAAGIASVAFFLVLIARFWHPVYGFSSFIQLDGASESLKIDTFRDLPIYIYPGEAGYDGLYYAQLAQDPTLRHPQFPRAMDNFAYRARRILPPALAWLLGAGRPAWIVQTYSLINVLAWLALAAILWRLLAVEEWRGWLAWVGVLFSAGALFSVRLALSDLVALAFVAGALLAAERSRSVLAAGTLAAAGLARETTLIALVGFVERPWFTWRNVLRSFVAVVPLALWLCYIRWRVGPSDQGWANFTFPVAGLIEKWGASLRALRTVDDHVLAWTTFLATVGVTVQAAYFLTRWQLTDRWWRLGVASSVLMLTLGTAVWEGYPGAALRVLLPLTLAFNILVHRARAPVIWLLAGNLTVFSGLLALRDVPRDPTELATLRSDGTFVVARLGGGWFGVESARNQQWTWSSGHSTVTFESWPKRPGPLQLSFDLSSLPPCTVVVRQDGRELAQWPARRPLVLHSVTVNLDAAGRASLDFSTDTPGLPESSNSNARSLTFALFHAHLAVPSP